MDAPLTNYQIRSVLGTWLQLKETPLAHYCRSQLGEGQVASEATYFDSVVLSCFEERREDIPLKAMVAAPPIYASSCGGIDGSEGAPLSHAHAEH